MNDTISNISGLLVNIILLFLFFKFLWPLISKYISVVDSAIIALVAGLTIRSRIFHGNLHPVFLIILFAAIFIGSMWIMYTKYGFIISSLFLSYLWTDIILSCCKDWASYDIIWGIFIGICSFALIFYFHWKDYKMLQAK